MKQKDRHDNCNTKMYYQRLTNVKDLSKIWFGAVGFLLIKKIILLLEQSRE